MDRDIVVKEGRSLYMRIHQNLTNHLSFGEKEAWVWACNREEFIVISLKELNRSWVALIKGGWRFRIVQGPVWNHPPPSIFKLNFDGSLVQSVQQGRIGGVIRDWNGLIIRNFYGQVGSSDANEAELFALLIGCRELRRI